MLIDLLNDLGPHLEPVSSDDPWSWQAQRNCGPDTHHLFFPGQGETSKRAKALCAECPVVHPCLEFALAQPANHDWGIWGGTTERERYRIRRQREARRAG